MGMGGDQPAAAAAAAAACGVVRDAKADPSQPQSVYHHSALPVQHDAGRPPRVTSPPPTSSSSMSMSQPPLLPPLQQQQQHYDGGAHMSMQQSPTQPPSSTASMHQHAYPVPYQPPQQQQHTFAYQNGGMSHPASMPSNMLVNGNGTMRYALPPQVAQNNMASRTASAKQIKRRTKTGCLTCRKRRIKCDETHPTCRNCQKSKRECLGYDPIFKQQPGPAAIQPAPATATPTSPSVSQPSKFSPTQSYATSASGLYPSPHQAHSDAAFDFAPSLDPTLGSNEQAFVMAQSNGAPLQPARKESSVTMAQLFALNDIEPRWQKREAPPTDFASPEIKPFFMFHYAQGLDKLFETTWYTEHGWAHMQQDGNLVDFVSQCCEQMKSSANDAASMQALPSLEARLVWQLCIMPRSAHSSNQAYGAISDPRLSDLLPRIDTVENILTGQFLPMVQIPAPPGAELQNDHRKYNEMHFWHQLGRIASTHDDSPDPAATRDINNALASMRSVLGLLENRDVLYSLAIARNIGGRLPEYDPLTPLHKTGNPDNEMDKLETARGFIQMENEKGMTQVIQRICGMAMRSSVLQRR